MDTAEPSSPELTRTRRVRKIVVWCGVAVAVAIVALIFVTAPPSVGSRYCAGSPVNPAAFPTREEALADYVAQNPGFPPAEKWHRDGNFFINPTTDDPRSSKGPGDHIDYLEVTKDYITLPDSEPTHGWAVTSYCTKA